MKTLFEFKFMAQADSRLVTLVDLADKGDPQEQNLSRILLKALQVVPVPPDPMNARAATKFFLLLRPHIRELIALDKLGDNTYPVRCIRGWRTVASGREPLVSNYLAVRTNWLPSYI